MRMWAGIEVPTAMLAQTEMLYPRSSMKNSDWLTCGLILIALVHNVPSLLFCCSWTSYDVTSDRLPVVYWKIWHIWAMTKKFLFPEKQILLNHSKIIDYIPSFSDLILGYGDHSLFCTLWHLLSSILWQHGDYLEGLVCSSTYPREPGDLVQVKSKTDMLQPFVRKMLLGFMNILKPKEV